MTKEAEQMFTNELNDLVDEQKGKFEKEFAYQEGCRSIQQVLDIWNIWYKLGYQRYRESVIATYSSLVEQCKKNNPKKVNIWGFDYELIPQFSILDEEHFDYIVEKRKEYDKENES